MCLFHVDRYKQLQSLFGSKSLKKKVMQEVTNGGTVASALNPTKKQVEKIINKLINHDYENRLVCAKSELSEANLKLENLFRQNSDCYSQISDLSQQLHQCRLSQKS